MSITIGTDYYSSIMNTLSSTKTTESLSDSLGRVSADTTDEELMEACKSFESYFVEQMYKGMEKTIMKAEDEEKSNDYLSYFKDTMYQNYAETTMEQGGFGLAQILYDSMKRNA